MQTRWVATWVLASAWLSAAAFAQGYVGVGAGQARVDVDCSGTTRCDKTDTAFKLYGGYLFMPYVGAEAVYFDQGKVSLSGVDPSVGAVTAQFKGRGYGLYAMGVVPIEQFWVFAKLGVVSARVKIDATSSIFGSAGTSERHTNAAWGLGAGYRFTQNLGARVEFERIRVEFLDEKNDADLLTIGVHYQF